MNLLENYIYLYHLDKFCVLPSMPDPISDQMSSSFTETNALARSAPVQTYSKSGPRIVNFTIELHRDIMEDLNTQVSNLKDNVVDFKDKDYVDVLLNYLQACALPKYNVYKTGSKAVDPPQVAVRMGNDIFVRGVITSGITVTYNKPILDNGKYAKVTVGFTITEVDPYDAPTVAMVGGFRGVTSTFKGGIYKDKSDTISYSGQEYTKSTSNSDTTQIRKTSNKINLDYVVPQTLTQKKIPGNNSLWIIDPAKNIKLTNITSFKTDEALNGAIKGTLSNNFGKDTSALNLNKSKKINGSSFGGSSRGTGVGRK